MAKATQVDGTGEDTVMDDWFNFAAAEIYQTYGDKVEMSRKSLHKYGRGANLGTSETDINYLSRNEVYVDSNVIDTLSSSNAGDAQIMCVEGLTLNGGKSDFITQQVLLDGQNKVPLSTPLCRATRLHNLSLAATVGDVYVYQDSAITGGVPDNLDLVHNVMSALDQVSLKAATSVATNNYFLMLGWYADVAKKTAASADIRLKVARSGGHFATQMVREANNDKGIDVTFAPYLIVRPTSDIALTSIASTTGVDIAAGFFGFFADIVQPTVAPPNRIQWARSI